MRRRLGAAVTDGFFLGAAKGAGLLPVASPRFHKVTVEKNIPYRRTGREAHTLDVYRPRDGSGPLPIVLYLHGGGFRFMSKDTHWLFGLIYARRGYLVVNVNYHLAPEHPFPGAVEDVSAAWQWLVENAARLGGDLSRVVVAGESAGANLAASLTLMTHQRRDESYARDAYGTGVTAKAVVAACGLFEVSNPERFRAHHTFFRDRIEEVTDAYLHGVTLRDRRTLELADPVVALEGLTQLDRPLPPFFLPCGTWDLLMGDTQRMVKALHRLGSTRSEAREYPRGPHAFHAFVVTPQALRCWKDTFTFLSANV
ncbi:MAG: alpha/beta hydrolase fold domain-containing protein [Archangium sp.]|nr:alpha/beta hydrolase fold domain-containing protein [Archangium sp.]